LAKLEAKADRHFSPNTVQSHGLWPLLYSTDF